MVLNRITLSLLLLNIFLSNNATAMDKKDWKKIADGYITEDGIPLVFFPVSDIPPYNTDPELYEKEFKDSLRIELYIHKEYGKSSEELLKNIEDSKLSYLQQQKQEIIQRITNREIEQQQRNPLQ